MFLYRGVRVRAMFCRCISNVPFTRELSEGRAAHEGRAAVGCGSAGPVGLVAVHAQQVRVPLRDSLCPGWGVGCSVRFGVGICEVGWCRGQRHLGLLRALRPRPLSAGALSASRGVQPQAMAAGGSAPSGPREEAGL